MGNQVDKRTEENKLINQISSGNFELKIKHRNYLRKVFLKNLKKVLILLKEIESDKIEQKMTEEMKNILPIFDGKDYKMWKKRLTVFLRYKECEEAILHETRVETISEATWKRKDLKAMNYIYSVLSPKQFEIINEEETSYNIIKKLDKLYLEKSTALQICIRRKLDTLKFSDYTETSEFFSEFEKLINELKSAGATVTEREKMDYMLRTLPISMSYIGNLIDSVKEDDQTTEYVKNKITVHERQFSQDEEQKKSSESTAFKVENKNNTKVCYKCGKPGHLQRQCWNPTPHQSQSRGRSNENRGKGYAQQEGASHRPQSQDQYYNNNNRGRGRAYRGRANWHQQSWHQQKNRGNNTGASYSESVSTDGEAFCSTGKNKVKGNVNNNVNTSEINVSTKEIEWILDSGCSDHIVNNVNYFSTCIDLDNPFKVKIGDGKILTATKVGKVNMNFEEFNKEVVVNNVFYIEQMNSNLLSFGKITKNYKIVACGNDAKIYNKNSELVTVAYKKNNIYKINSTLQKDYKISCNMTMKEKYHKMLGHVNFKYLEILGKNQLLENMPINFEDEYLKCKVCIENKMHNMKFDHNRRRAKDLLEIIHADLSGPHRDGLCGEKYFLVIVDDYSKFVKVYTLKSKTETVKNLIAYVNLFENITGKKVKKLRCDNGLEFINSEVRNFSNKKGIIIDTCPPYVHELNGTAERYIRLVMDMARCLLADAKLDRKYWPEAVKAAAYLKNRTLANTVEKKTPYEILLKEKPNIKNLKVYGSKAYVRIPEAKRNSKWAKKAEEGVLVGYENVGYRILVNGKVIVAKHVEFIDTNVKLVGISENESSTDNEIESNEDSEYDSTFEDGNVEKNTEKNEKVKEKVITRRKSNRDRKEPDRYKSENYSTFIYVNFASANTPQNFSEAINSSESINWQEAMTNELKCIKKNDTYELVERPTNKKIINVKWVYTKKSENKFKARLVVRGFEQKETIEDIYSPVAKTQTLKIFLNICLQKMYIINQMDVESAFLNGYLKSEIYVKQPEGFDDNSGRVWKLKKALYGLRESPRVWYECLDEYLENIGFKRSDNDYCLYIKDDKTHPLYLIIFVDDLLIGSKDQIKIDEVKALLRKKFNMKDMGTVKTYLGISIEYERTKGVMKLDQTNYIESLANKYNIKNSKLYETPMEQNLKCEPTQSASEHKNYRNLIGALLYISSGTRPDISFSVNYLSRFQNCSNQTLFKYALRVLKYLFLTKNLKLTYERNLKDDILKVYVDADWAGDVIDRKSISGYVIKLFDNVIFWKSKKQRSVTKSSTAAEYVALSEAVSEVLCTIELLKDFDINIKKPVEIYEDNTGALNIAKYGNYTKNSKYIETHYHFVNENFKRKIIDIVKVKSEDNEADIFTKALGRIKFKKFRKNLKII